MRPTIQPSPPQPPATVTALHEPGRCQPAQTAHHRIEIHPRGDRDPGRPRPGPGRDGLQHPGAVRVEQVTREHRPPRPAGISPGGPVRGAQGGSGNVAGLRAG